MGSLPSLFIFSTTCIFSTTSIGFARHSQHHQMHIYRVPKTGSTTLITTMGKMKCAHLTLHDHSDGCKDLNWCNGSKLAGVLPTQPVVAGLRHVCDRLKSQWRHMRYVHPSPPFGNISILQFVELLQNWTRGCPEGSAGVHCKVIKIKRHCSKNCPGVILWPQAFYMARRTVPICYHPVWLTTRIENKVKALASCHAELPRAENTSLVEQRTRERVARASETARGAKTLHANEGARRICEAAKLLYDVDHWLWLSHCQSGFPE